MVGPARQWLLGLLLGLPLALGWLVGSATPAAAHTEIVRTEPTAGAVLPVPPRAVVLQFNEPVSTQFASVLVAGPDGQRLDVGSARVRRTTVTMSMRTTAVPAGTYTVVWRVVSDDNHPISGRFTFSVGVPSTPGPAVAAQIARTIEAASVPRATQVLLGAGRLVEYAGFVLLVGVLVVIAWAWSAGAALKRVRRLAWAGWLTVLAGTTLSLLMQGPDAAARGPLSALTEFGLLRDVLAQRYGQVHVARIAALAAVTPGLALSWAARARSSPRHGAVLAATLGFLAATWSLAGHAGSRSPVPVSVAVDALHLLAVASWLGGLVVVGSALLRSGEADSAAARWSRLAFGSVLVLTATGTWTAVAEVPSWDALTGSEYGRLLSAKVALVAVMVGLGGLARQRLRRRGAAGLSATVRLEALLGGVVLVLASLLVAADPSGRV